MRVDTVRAPNPGPFTLDGTRTYVLDRNVVVDPGPSIASHVDAVMEHLDRAPLVLLTHRHPDHVPAAEDLRQRAAATVWGPRGAGVPLERVLTGGELVEWRGVTLRVVETPGHTAEHLCYLGGGGELFSGDTVLGSGTTAILPPDGNMGDYLASLRRLREMGPVTIYPGHGPVREDAVQLIDEYLEHRRMREEQILEGIRNGADSVAELRARIYGELDAALWEAAESQISAHVDHLRDQGKVRAGRGLEPAG